MEDVIRYMLITAQTVHALNFRRNHTAELTKWKSLLAVRSVIPGAFAPLLAISYPAIKS